jgi:hypothetical protein
MRAQVQVQVHTTFLNITTRPLDIRNQDNA